MEKTIINIVANSQISFESMGGSDKIFIEMAKVWKRQGRETIIFGCREAGKMCDDAGLKKYFREISAIDFEKHGLFLTYFARTIKCLFYGRLVKEGILYSSSDFFPDLFFALVQKLRNRKIKWAAGLFLIAPNPLKQKYALTARGLIYWVSQILAIWLMKMWADFVVVLCNDDRDFLLKKGFRRERVIIISGGIDMSVIDRVLIHVKKYDACFLGRFHPQKGILELLDIWRMVVDEIPRAKLAIVGWGDEYFVKQINDFLAKNKLQKNIFLLGFLDNEKKYEILKKSKIFVFPSLYESWGIVVAEAFGCGCPVVTFDIEATRKFKKGIIKVGNFDAAKFAKSVVGLLKDKRLREKFSKEACEASKLYDWEMSANLIGDL